MRARYLLIPAAVLLLTACGSAEPASEATDAAPAAEEATTEEAVEEVHDPDAYPITGDFEADLESIGVHLNYPAEEFRASYKRDLCDSDLQETVGPGSFAVMVKRYGGGDPSGGMGPDVVRLVISYDCPDRADGAEEYLSELA